MVIPLRGAGSAAVRRARRLKGRTAARVVLLALTLAAVVVMSACSNVGYYAQAIGGHLSLMRARQPIKDLLADPELDTLLRTRLETLVEAREFAHGALGLPDTDSYRTYAQTGRRYVTWNVIAAEEFSVEPYTWCFPVAGCVNYRGYFDEADAKTYAETFKQGGYDVTLGGASAYSTLGWFDDPVLDTMLRGNDVRYVGTLFHEMAHQKLYVQNDSDFNEAFASFVEQDGVRRWLSAREEQPRIADYDASLARGEQFQALLGSTRSDLETLYASALDEAAMRDAKRAAFAQMRKRYETLKASWDGFAGYDGWFARELNNARLVSVATYRRNLPAFAALMDEAGGDLAAFHERASALAELPDEQRQVRLEALREAGNSPAS